MSPLRDYLPAALYVGVLVGLMLLVMTVTGREPSCGDVIDEVKEQTYEETGKDAHPAVLQHTRDSHPACQ